jgi:hypothetical protein
MARVRTQKAVASRIDLNYHRKPHPWRRTRVGLVMLCMLGAGAWFAFSSVRFKDGKPVLVDSIHNPGPVARAHAQIEQDCKACHDGNGEKGYWLSVSDQACLKCHDGSLHHMNQKLADSHAGANKAELIMAVKDDKHAGAAVSANCVSCHIEHRGHEALAGTSDQHCITCHENVDRAMQPGTKRESAVRVIAFNAADHPRFGRKLAAAESASGDRQWSDPTRLRYNHKFHMEKIRKKNAPADLAADLATDCVACHSAFAPQLDRVAADADKKPAPPYFTSKDGSLAAYSSSDTRFIQPVSFDAHCAACHTQTALPIPPKGWTLSNVTVKDTLKEEFVVSHVDLSLVRAEVESNLRKFMDGKSEFNATKPGEPGTQPAGGAAPAGPARRGPGAPKTGPGATAGKPADVAVKLPPADWLRIAAAATAKRTNDLLKENTERYKARGLEGQTLAEPAATDEISPAVLADYYTAYIAVSSCIQCHDLEGNLPGVTGFAEDKSQRLRTVPTGMPKTPRRWFAASTFDHYAHRQMDCRGCHAPAWKSEATENVLTADIDGRYSGATSLNVAAAGQSCVSCHHADTSHVKGAPANCVTCHEYHDHKFERSIDNPLIGAASAAQNAAPATQPAQ